jgi:TonB family protein
MKTTLLLTATLCLLAPAVLSADKGAVEVDQARTTLKKWVETRRIISQEKRDWALAREVLNGRLDLVQREIEAQRDKIGETEASIAEVQHQQAELMEEAPPLDLSQLELALNPGDGAGLLGDFVNQLNPLTSSGAEVDALFSMADLDQKPRVLYQPGPVLNKQIRQQAPGTVYIIFIVDQRGRVENPIVQKSSDPVFERSALAAVKQWKFEPGKRNGQPVRFRMRVPITFPKG